MVEMAVLFFESFLNPYTNIKIYACNAFYAYSLSLGVPLTLRRQTDWALR